MNSPSVARTIDLDQITTSAKTFEAEQLSLDQRKTIAKILFIAAIVFGLSMLMCPIAAALSPGVMFFSTILGALLSTQALGLISLLSSCYLDFSIVGPQIANRNSLAELNAGQFLQSTPENTSQNTLPNVVSMIDELKENRFFAAGVKYIGDHRDNVLVTTHNFVDLEAVKRALTQEQNTHNETHPEIIEQTNSYTYRDGALTENKTYQFPRQQITDPAEELTAMAEKVQTILNIETAYQAGVQQARQGRQAMSCWQRWTTIS